MANKVQNEIYHDDGHIERFTARYERGGNCWKTKTALIDPKGNVVKEWAQTHYGRDIDMLLQGANDIVDKHSLNRQTRMGNDKGGQLTDHNITPREYLSANESPYMPTGERRSLYED